MSETHEKERYRRYERVLRTALGRERFSLAEVKEACASERPAFVTSLIRQLEQDGYLERSGPKSRPAFQWVTERRAEFTPTGWIEQRLYGPKIQRTPRADRPRERLLASGSGTLRTAELLAILIRTGRPGESALQAGEKVAAHFSENMGQLAEAGRGELRAISQAITEPAYCQILAGIELGRRVAAAEQAEVKPAAIGGPSDAVAYCQQTFGRIAEDAKHEQFHIVTLDTKHRVINQHQVSRGTLDGAEVHPREVFRPAIKDAAAAILLVHNHPSGDPSPSPEDFAITRRLEEAGKTVGIDVLDHIVVAKSRSVSIQSQRR